MSIIIILPNYLMSNLLFLEPWEIHTKTMTYFLTRNVRFFLKNFQCSFIFVQKFLKYLFLNWYIQQFVLYLLLHHQSIFFLFTWKCQQQPESINPRNDISKWTNKFSFACHATFNKWNWLYPRHSTALENVWRYLMENKKIIDQKLFILLIV